MSAFHLFPLEFSSLSNIMKAEVIVFTLSTCDTVVMMLTYIYEVCLLFAFAMLNYNETT